MPKLNLALLDHRSDAVRDQIFFLQLTCKSLGIELIVQQNVDRFTKNIIIEGNISDEFKADSTYIKGNSHQFSVILTEHLDFSATQGFVLNGIPVDSDFSPEIDPNIFPAVRFRSLIENFRNIPLFLTCGDLPTLGAYGDLLPNSSFAQLPWPRHSISTIKSRGKGLVFSIPDLTLLTPFRLEVLKEISLHDCKVKIFHSESIDASLKNFSKFPAVLDIAKSSQWKFDSPMRAFMAILAGRPRVNIRNTANNSPISNICDLTFMEYLRYSPAELDGFADQIPSKFDSFVAKQDFRALKLFSEWFYS